VRAEQRSVLKKDLADTLKFDELDENPRRSSTLNEYLESFALEFLPNFKQSRKNLKAEQELLTKQWKAVNVEVKKLRSPLIPRIIPVLCVSPRRSVSSEISSKFPQLR